MTPTFSLSRSIHEFRTFVILNENIQNKIKNRARLVQCTSSWNAKREEKRSSNVPNQLRDRASISCWFLCTLHHRMHFEQPFSIHLIIAPSWTMCHTRTVVIMPFWKQYFLSNVHVYEYELRLGVRYFTCENYS